MNYSFKVEAIIEQKPVMVIARTLFEGNFEFSEFPTLGNCEIKNSLSQPRALRGDGSPDLDVYCFYLKNRKDKNRLIIGSIVELL